MLKSTNKHVGIFSFIGNNILMFIFTLAFGALITSRGIDLSAVTPVKIFFSAMYIGLVFVVSSVCGYHNNRGGLIGAAAGGRCIQSSERLAPRWRRRRV